MRDDVKKPLIAASVCGALLVALLVTAYAIGPFPEIDARALSGLESLQGPIASPFLDSVARTADPVPLAAITLVLLGAGFAVGRRRQALTAAAAIVVANVLTQVLKIALAHPRFHSILAGDQIGATAFPSGHATAAMSVALGAVIVSPPRVRSRISLPAAVYALAVATAILVQGWHFPSDVLAGFLVASGTAFAAVAASRSLAARDPASARSAGVRIDAPPVPLVVASLALAAAIVLARSGDLLQFAREHTSGALALAGVATACGALLAGASHLADR